MKLTGFLAPIFFSLAFAQNNNTTADVDTTTIPAPTAPAPTVAPTPPAPPPEPSAPPAPQTTTIAGAPEPTVAPTPPTTGNGNNCAATIRRQEVRDMSTADWESFVAAFKAMNQDGSLAKYVNWHMSAWTRYHWNSKFLPFHRAYMLEFERDLMTRGAAFLPYWDSTKESQDPPSSPLLTAKYFGANDGRHIVDGPFARAAPMSYRAVVGGGPLIRQYGSSTGAFYAKSIIDNEIMRSGFSDFSNRLEIGPHSVVHSIIGGSGGQLASAVSPEDPLFWVHHCFMDKLWDDQQRQYGYKYEGDAFNENAQESDVIGFAPWARPVSEVLRSDDICVSYSAVGNGGGGDGGDGDGETGDNGEGAANETVRVPEIAENFLNGTGANLTFVQQLANETKVTVEKINTKVESQKDGGLVLSVSVGLITLAFALI
jgi:hypothetical protein